MLKEEWNNFYVFCFDISSSDPISLFEIDMGKYLIHIRSKPVLFIAVFHIYIFIPTSCNSPYLYLSRTQNGKITTTSTYITTHLNSKHTHTFDSFIYLQHIIRS